MARITVIIFVSFLLILISCGKDPNDISNLGEKELLKKAEEFYQQKNTPKTIECFQLFIKKFPKSDQAIPTLKNLASIYSDDLKDWNNAIAQYKIIISDYPDSKECPNAVFTIGFIYANELKDNDQAKIYYEQFLQKYPNHEAAASARFELENLGKNTEDVLNNLIKKEAK